MLTVPNIFSLKVDFFDGFDRWLSPWTSAAFVFLNIFKFESRINYILFVHYLLSNNS